jgi:hypothetical protein
MITLTCIQARFLEVASILGRAPALRLNEIVLLQEKDGSRGLMTADEGGLRWVKMEELQEYVEACREALASGEALLDGLSRPEPEVGTTASYLFGPAVPLELRSGLCPACGGAAWPRPSGSGSRQMRPEPATIARPVR